MIHGPVAQALRARAEGQPQVAGLPFQPRRGSEQNFDGELAGARAADLIERTHYAKLLVERLSGRPETGRPVHREHWMIQEVEVLCTGEQASPLGKMRLPAQGKVGLVDGKSAEVV
jgi:hypothetical protein